MRLPKVAIALLTLSAAGFACSGGIVDGASSQQSSGGASSSSGELHGEGGNGGGGAGSQHSSGGASSSSGELGEGGSQQPAGSSTTSASTGPGAGESCATQSASAALEPVYLAFALDVSGSMGSNAQPWYSRELKWDPVITAMRAFFEDPTSEGLTASLTFFPEGSRRDMCALPRYTTPDVEMTPLPSEHFFQVIEAITPEREEDWGTGTPTMRVPAGTAEFIRGRRATNPGKYAIVLVTDGYPEGCNDDTDNIESVVEVAQEAFGEGISTFVVGIANPPVEGAPDTVSNLNDIAAAGGSERAFLIDTGDPQQTAHALNMAIDAILDASVPCTIEIPAPPDGRTFDKSKVRVTTTSGAGAPTTLDYDQECAAGSAWRYDDPESPAQIVLCPGACAAIASDPEASLTVDFTC